MPEIIELFKDMVSDGHAPGNGCRLFGVGYEEAFIRLEREILDDSLTRRGKSVEKFIVGPYGSGKTHFLRQLMEIARDKGFITSEVQLSKDINIVEGLEVYKEVVRNIITPEKTERGINSLIVACLKKVRKLVEDPTRSDEVIEKWIDAFKENVPLEHKGFTRVMYNTLKTFASGEEERFEKGIRWLEGEVTDKKIARELDVEVVSRQQANRFARSALFSLCQFIRYAGFPGTIIGYDEAEQSVNVSSRKREDILSMFRQEMVAITDVKNASIFAIYALTPDVIQEMRSYPALQGRVSDPDPSRGFFEGSTYAPQIDLSKPYTSAEESLQNLRAIGKRLVDLFYSEYGDKVRTPHEIILKDSKSWAEEIARGTASISNRRDMVKLCCSRLIDIYRTEFEKVDIVRAKKADGGPNEEEV